jgi:hypothetical protein
VRSQATPGLARDQKLDASRCSLCAYKPNDPVSCGQKAHAFSLNVRFFPSDPRSCTRPKSSLLTVRFLQRPRFADKRLTLFPSTCVFSKRPQVLHAAKKARCSPCAYNPNDPVSCGQKAHAFSAQRAFSSDPGSCPRSETRCSPCANNNKTTNQQSTTNNKCYSQISTYPPLRSPHPCYQGSHSRRRFLRHIVAWPEQIRTTAISRQTLRKNYNTMEKNGLTL